MLSADRSLKKINLGFPQEQNSICFHVRSNGISEGCADFIQILGKTTAGQMHQQCQSTQVQDCEHQSCTWKALWLRGPESSELQPCRDETQKSLGQSMSTEFWHLQQGYRTVSACLHPSSPLCSARITKGRFYLWEHVSKKCFLEGGQTVLGTQSQPAGKSDTDIPICSPEAWKDLKNGEK